MTFVSSHHHPSWNQHLTASRPLQPINTQMLSPVSPYVYSEGILRRPFSTCLSTNSRNDQFPDQVRFGLWVPERRIRQQRALVHETEQIRQRVDLVREVPFSRWPDEEE